MDPLRFISLSKDYGFLLAANEYWASRLILNRQMQGLVEICERELNLSLPAPPDLTQKMARLMANIAHSTPSLLSPAAGLWISEQSVFPIAACIHTLAGLGGLHSEEMAVIKSSISGAKGAAFTHGFLRSVAADSAKVKGDMDRPDDAHHIGTRWYE